MATRKDRDLPSHPGKTYPGTAGFPRVPERAVTPDSILQIEDTEEGVSFVNSVSVNAERKLIEVFRSGTDEPTDNLFKRGFDTLDEVQDSDAYQRLDSNMADGSGRIIQVFRSSITEPVSNLFKRGVDTLNDIQDSSTYRKVASGFTDVSNRITSLFRSGSNEPSENLFKRGVDTLGDVVDGSGFRKITDVFSDASNRLTSIFRGATNEPAENLFKRGVDGADDVVEDGSRGFVHPGLTDASRRPNKLRRSSTDEPAENLFKRGVDGADDVVEDGSRGFVHPSMTDGSRKPDRIRRSSTDEPAENLFKRNVDDLDDVKDGSQNRLLPNDGFVETFQFPGVGGSNVLSNPGFERGDSYWNSGPSTVILDGTKARTGDRYLKTVWETSDGLRTNYFTEPNSSTRVLFPVSEGDVITFGGWFYREAGDATVGYGTSFRDEDGSAVQYNSPSLNPTNGVWTKQELQAEAPAGTAFVIFYTLVRDNGTAETTVRWDDAFLRIHRKAEDIDEDSERGFVHPDMTDGSRKPDRLRRSSVDEPAENLFKRNVDTLDDVEDGSTYKKMTAEEYRAALSVAPQGTNLIPNAGFDQGQIFWSSEGSFEWNFVNLDSNYARTGEGYLNVRSDGGQAFSYCELGDGSRVEVPVQAGQIVSFGGWIRRVAGDGTIQIGLQRMADDGSSDGFQTVNSSSGDTDWTLLSETFEVPSGVSSLQFKCAAFEDTEQAQVLFDDCYLVIHQSVEQITDAASEAFTFEQGRSWVAQYAASGAGTDLLYHDGSILPRQQSELGNVYLVWAERTDWTTPNGAISAFYTDENGDWHHEILYTESTATGHPVLYVSAAADNPRVGTYGDTGSTGDFDVYIEEYTIPQTPTLWAALGLAEDGWVVSGLEDGVGQDNGSEIMPLAKGYASGEASDGDAVVFNRSFDGAPMVIIQGGITYEPRSGQYDNGYTSTLPTYKENVAEGVSAAGFTVRSVIYQTGSPTQRSHTSGFSDTLLTGQGQKAERNLDHAPSGDGNYTFEYDVSINNEFSTLSGNRHLKVELQTNTDGAGWVTRASQTYNHADLDEKTWNGETLTANVSGLDDTDDIRILIALWEPVDSGNDALLVEPVEVRYVTDSGSTEATATPETTDKITWKALETS